LAHRCFHTAAQTVGRTHRDAAHDAVAELLLDFEGQAFFGEGFFAGILQQQRVIYAGHIVARKLDIHHRTNTLNDLSDTHY
jgi:hypothetical protein